MCVYVSPGQLVSVGTAVLLQIYGLFLVKLAVAITLIGGCARRDDSGTHIRGESHMLLIGDPGTGKSQVQTRYTFAKLRVVLQCWSCSLICHKHHPCMPDSLCCMLLHNQHPALLTLMVCFNIIALLLHKQQMPSTWHLC